MPQEPYNMTVDLTVRFMGILKRAGCAPADVAYEGYKFAAALQGNFEQSIHLEHAALIAEAAARRTGIHTTQQMAGEASVNMHVSFFDEAFFRERIKDALKEGRKA